MYVQIHASVLLGHYADFQVYSLVILEQLLVC